MSARSGSLGWVVIVAVISLGVAGALWGLLDSQFINTLTATGIWQAPPGSAMHQGRQYVLTTWQWFLLLPLLRVGLESLVSSRLVGASTMLPFATLVLLFAHVLVVLWMLTIPELGKPLYDIATNTSTASGQAVNATGYDTGVTLAWDWGVGVLPAVLLLITDVWYLSAPIRNDVLRQ